MRVKVGVTTPESLKRLPKVNSLCEADDFKSQYRGTSLIRNRRPPQDHHKLLGIRLPLGPTGGEGSYDRRTSVGQERRFARAISEPSR